MPVAESLHQVLTDDCLNVLTTLGRDGLSADVAYLDPPYGTGRRDLSHSDALTGSEWVEWLRVRAQAVRAVLGRSGVLLASVDDTHHAHLRLLLDGVFGGRCHLATIVLDGASSPSARFVSTGHEYVLAYARSFDALVGDGVRWREPRPGVPEILAAGQRALSEAQRDDTGATLLLKAWRAALPRTHVARSTGLADYNWIVDGQVVRWGPLGKAHPNELFRYDVPHPVTGGAVPMPSNGWRWTRERMAAEVATGGVRFGPDEKSPPRAVLRLADMGTSPPPSVITARRGAGRRRLDTLVPGHGFAYPKDPTLLARMLSWCLPTDGTVLDPFAGSGSTLDAVVALNAGDSGTRRCISIEKDTETVERVLLPRAEALGVAVTTSSQCTPERQ